MTMQVSAYGWLGKDLKAIQTQSGKAMTTASLAVRLDCREDGETRESLAVIVDALLSARSTRPGGNRRRNDNQGNDRQDSPPDYPPADPEPYRQRADKFGQGNDPDFVDDDIPF